MDREAWQATVQGVTKSQTRLLGPRTFCLQHLPTSAAREAEVLSQELQLRSQMGLGEGAASILYQLYHGARVSFLSSMHPAPGALPS